MPLLLNKKTSCETTQSHSRSVLDMNHLDFECFTLCIFTNSGIKMKTLDHAITLEESHHP